MAYESAGTFNLPMRIVTCCKIQRAAMVILNSVITVKNTVFMDGAVLRMIAAADKTYAFKIFHAQIIQYFAQNIYFIYRRYIV